MPAHAPEHCSSTTITIVQPTVRKMSGATLKTISTWEEQEKPSTPPSPTQSFSSSHSFYVPVHSIDELDLNSKENILLFGYFNLKRFSRPIQFLLCGGGVLVFYVLQSIAKEYLFLTYQSEINFSCFLALVQCFGYTLLAALQMLMFQENKSKQAWRPPHKIGGGSTRFLILMMIIGLLGDVSMAFSNISLQFLPFPTFVMVKSCKVLAAMFLSVSLHQLQRLYLRMSRKHSYQSLFKNPKYNRLDYVAAFVLVLGLIVLAVANPKESIEFSSLFLQMDWRGIILALLAVMADAMVSLIQELAMKEQDDYHDHPLKQRKEEPVSVILYSYGFGFVILFIYSALISDEFWVVTKFALFHPKFIFILLCFTILGHLGINCTLALLKQFGAFISLTTASCRKAVTIVLSFLIFAKPLTVMYQLAIALVFAGIVINVYNKNLKHRS